MRIGASLFLIALGAILKFAVNTQRTHGFDIGVIGLILMIVGAVGLLITAAVMSTRRRTEVIHRRPGGRAGTTYVSPDESIDAPY